MQSARVSLNRLKNPKSKVSCHYFIERNGKICRMVEDNKTAWHAGKSKYKERENFNEFSIGIELEGSVDDIYHAKGTLIRASKACIESSKWLLFSIVRP